MKATVFYSWQSDTPGATNRNLILQALEDAAKEIASDDLIDVVPVIDRDTQGVAGSPDIGRTILEKIKAADLGLPQDAPSDPDRKAQPVILSDRGRRSTARELQSDALNHPDSVNMSLGKPRPDNPSKFHHLPTLPMQKTRGVADADPSR